MDYKLVLFMISAVIFMIGGVINYLIVTNHTFEIDKKKKQIKFQKILSEMLFELIDLNQKNFNSKINMLLKKIGIHYGVDRVYLFTINQSQKTMTYSHEWCDTGIKPEIETIKNVPLNEFPWIINQLYRNKLLIIEDVTTMPIEAILEQQKLYNQGVKSLVIIPIIGESGMIAFVGIDSVIETREWSNELIESLNAVAAVLYKSMVQIDVDKEIEFKAYHDSLTNLANRYLFIERADEAIQSAKQSGYYVAILFIDVDNFKEINDTLGHTGADHVLQEVATRLSKAIRKSDTIARYGGDEFLIMLNHITNYNVVKTIAKKIIEVFAKPFIVNGQELIVTVSLGIAVYPMDGEDVKTLIEHADFAMYEAKTKGKNQYVLYTYITDNK